MAENDTEIVEILNNEKMAAPDTLAAPTSASPGVVTASSPPVPPRPCGYQDVVRHFGPGSRHRARTGVVRLPELVGGRAAVYVHEDIAPVMQHFVRAVHDAGYWHLIRTIGGWRERIRRGARPSGSETRQDISGWGLALIINEAWNPYGELPLSKPVGEPWPAPGEEHQPGYRFYAGHPIVEIAQKCGLVWAGALTWPDGTHIARRDSAIFQYCGRW